MKSSEIREQFLKYFESKNHKRLAGSSLIPDDPTVLLTLAGMLQFKPIFLGQENPKNKRVTTVQKCVRMIDLENVGQTARHQTFFEMLGNFSFGDYFKEEAIEFAWELLTKKFKLPVEKLVIAIYEKDDEAFDIWHQKIGLPAEKIVRLDEENNFWSAGPTGPCGPCSEIYYDFGPQTGCGLPTCQPGCDCDRFLEVWNLVFIQYNRNEKKELIALKTKGIDTGMGLERIASVLQGVATNFETDLFVPLINKIKQKSKQDQPAVLSLNIIADHLRAATHLVADGVLPENIGRGYVLRRLIRRAIGHGRLLGIVQAFLGELVDCVVEQMGEAYPVLKAKHDFIKKTIVTEENSFLATLDQGLKLIEEILNSQGDDKVLSGKVAFKLHDTYGFPLELTKEIVKQRGYLVDEKTFTEEMTLQKERARNAGLSTSNKSKLLGINFDGISPTKFIGYEKESEKAKVLKIFPQENIVILDKTPFYGESGGQLGDTGMLKFGENEGRVVETLLTPSKIVIHVVDNLSAELKEKTKVEAIVDRSKRAAIKSHHTATHLLHQALRDVLGEQVKQAGSAVSPEKLRFDFNHGVALSNQEIEKVENIVNQKIAEKLKVEVLEKSYDEAVKLGAMALFGEKYGNKVRVLKIGDYSLELCGGTHVKSTEDILFFKILSEGALGSGVRRIEAVAGQVAKIQIVYQAKSLRDKVEKLIKVYRSLELEKEKLGGQKFSETNIFEIEITELDRLMQAVDHQNSQLVRKFLEHLSGRVDWLNERIAKAEKEIKQLKINSVSSEASEYLKEIKEIAGVKILLYQFEGYSMEMLRSISDKFQNEVKPCIVVLASAFPGRLIFLVKVANELVAKGYSAKKIADTFSSVVGGKGGGKEDKVEGGGKDPAKIKEAFAAVEKIIQ